MVALWRLVTLMKDTAFEILAFSGYIRLPKVLVLRQLMIPRDLKYPCALLVKG